MTYSFPCQDLSNAGKQLGMGKDSGTRSGLLWEVERLLTECEELPQVLIMENVPQVIGQKNIKYFADWVARLDSLGYKSKWQIINGTDFNVPQNRERCFMVSVLGDYYYDFPKPIGCKLRLKDLLEKEVDDKYYLNNAILDYFTNHSKEQEERGNGIRFTPTDGDNIARCVSTRAGSRMDDNFITAETEYNVIKLPHSYFKGEITEGKYSPTIDTGVGNWHTLLGIKCKKAGDLIGDKYEKMLDCNRRVYDIDGAAPTITTCGGGNTEPKICEPLDDNSIIDCYNKRVINNGICGIITTNGNTSSTHCGTFGIVEPLALDEQNRYIRKDGTCGTLTTDGNSPKHNNRVGEPSYKVRKLTERECGRLMGVKDTDFEKLKVNQSMSSCYHILGDSIIVDVLMAIIKEMI